MAYLALQFGLAPELCPMALMINARDVRERDILVLVTVHTSNAL